MPKSNYIKNLTLDYWLGSGAPATYYLALYTVAPTDAGGGTEVAGGSYARVAVTNNATNFPAAAAGIKHLAVTQNFPQATADWGTIVAMAMHDTAIAGNIYFWANLDVAQAIINGDMARFLANSITFTEL